MGFIKNAINMLIDMSINIKDVFYSALVFPKHYLEFPGFIWKGKIYQFLDMPNGYIDPVQKPAKTCICFTPCIWL